MPSPNPAGFLRTAAPGTRVVVRYRIPGGLTDALGELVSANDGECTVRTKRGNVVVDLGAVTAAKAVPPPPRRRARSD